MYRGIFTLIPIALLRIQETNYCRLSMAASNSWFGRTQPAGNSRTASEISKDEPCRPLGIFQGGNTGFEQSDRAELRGLSGLCHASNQPGIHHRRVALYCKQPTSGFQAFLESRRQNRHGSRERDDVIRPVLQPSSGSIARFQHYIVDCVRPEIFFRHGHQFRHNFNTVDKLAFFLQAKR